MELVADSIVPSGAFTAGPQKRMHAIAANNSGAAVAKDLRFSGSAATQAKAYAGDILFMVKTLRFVQVHVPKPVMVRISAGQVRKSI